MTEIPENAPAETVCLAAEENFVEFVRLLGQLPGTDFYEGDDVLWVITGKPHPLLNGVAKARLSPEAAGSRIAEILGRMEERNAPFIWWVGPSSSGTGIEEQLERHGLTRSDEWPCMAADLMKMTGEVTPPPGVTFEPIRDEERLLEWADLLMGVFEFSDVVRDVFYEMSLPALTDPQTNLYNFMALRDGKMVGTTTMVLTGGVAGIYNVAVAPEARRQGIGDTLTRSALLQARDKGYRVGTLQSSTMGYGVYQRIGFEDICKFYLYTRAS